MKFQIRADTRVHHLGWGTRIDQYVSVADLELGLIIRVAVGLPESSSLMRANSMSSMLTNIMICGRK